VLCRYLCTSTARIIQLTRLALPVAINADGLYVLPMFLDVSIYPRGLRSIDVKCTEVTESDGWRARLQARRQEMEWGFCDKVENGGCFVNKVKNGGCFFVKKWTFPQRRVHYVQYQYFLFYILLIRGGVVRTQRLRAWATCNTGLGRLYTRPCHIF